MKKYITTILLLFAGVSLSAQDNPLFTQQWFSRINHNPASAGNDKAWDIFMAHRNQWTGFKNAPKTTLLNAHTSINDFNSGVGLSVAYDSEGPARRNLIAKALYSYRINLTDESQLSFGLGGGIQNRSVDFNKLNTEDPGEIEIGAGKESKTTLGIDFGLEYLTERLVLGASVTNLGKKYEKLTTFQNGTQYYAYGHYRFPLSETYELSPTATYVYGNKEHLIEAGVTFFYDDMFWLGAAYRIDNAICLFGGFKFNIFRVGYSYDSHTNDAKEFGATHEICLSIRIPKTTRGKLTRNRDGSYSAPRNRVYRCR